MIQSDRALMRGHTKCGVVYRNTTGKSKPHRWRWKRRSGSRRGWWSRRMAGSPTCGRRCSLTRWHSEQVCTWGGQVQKIPPRETPPTGTMATLQGSGSTSPPQRSYRTWKDRQKESIKLSPEILHCLIFPSISHCSLHPFLLYRQHVYFSSPFIHTFISLSLYISSPSTLTCLCPALIILLILLYLPVHSFFNPILLLSYPVLKIL